MSITTRLKRSLLPALIIGASLTAVGSAQAQYSNLVVFGDSLSDNGVASTATNSSTTKYVFWNNALAAAYGLTLSAAWNKPYLGPSSSLTSSGTNFALGGGAALFVGNPAVATTGAQINRLLERSAGALDPQALYVLWSGGNDAGTLLFAVAGGKMSLNDAVANAAKAGAAAAAQARLLTDKGARNVVVMNHVDIAQTPLVKSQGAQAQQLAASLVSAYNTALAAGLQGAPVLALDAYSQLNRVLADPAMFGFDPTKKNDYLCKNGFGAPGAGQCSNTPSNGYMFADPFHPTEQLHAAVAQWIGSMLDATSAGTGIANVAAISSMGRSGAARRIADSRMNGFQIQPFMGDRMYGGADYASGSVDSFGSEVADATTQTFSVGFETNFGEGTLVGAHLARERGAFDLTGSAGRLVNNEGMLTLYASHRVGANAYANALLSYGSMRFNSTRLISMGAATLGETAEFGGKHYGAKLELGYQFRDADLVHGPYVGLDWEDVRVDGFTEGTSATAISVGKQSASQSHARIGYQLATKAGMLRPYARVSYDYQLNDSDRHYVVGVAATGAAMPVMQKMEKGGSGRVALGASVAMGSKTEISVGVTGTFDSPAGNDKALNVVISTAF